MTKIKSFINKYNWEGVNFEKNNLKIAFDVFYAKK